jgi:GntR family transcriptional regulator
LFNDEKAGRNGALTERTHAGSAASVRCQAVDQDPGRREQTANRGAEATFDRGGEPVMSEPSARILHQRRRPKPALSNNSVRRTYDLLRSSLPSMGPDARLVEHELVEAMSASRNTIRLVLQTLAQEGLVTRRQKIGTTVAGPIVLRADELMTVPEFSDGPTSRTTGPSRTTGRVIDTAVIAAPKVIRDRLRLAPDATVLVVEGVLVFDDAPVAVSVSYVGLPSESEDAPTVEIPDVVAFLEEQLDVCVGASSTTLGARLCDAQTAELLEVREGDPILYCEDVLYDIAGGPRALNQFKFRGDRVAMSATAHRRIVTGGGDEIGDEISAQHLHGCAERQLGRE